LGLIGIGIGKHTELTIAITKSILNAKNKLITINITNNQTISTIIKGKFRTANIIMKPGYIGQGLIAGKTIRTICELSGIKNISAKQLGSNNILNNAYATLKALNLLKKD
jgi:small subunit ribosomal protein S5